MILENKKTRDIGDAKIVQKSMNGTTKIVNIESFI